VALDDDGQRLNYELSRTGIVVRCGDCSQAQSQLVVDVEQHGDLADKLNWRTALF